MIDKRKAKARFYACTCGHCGCLWDTKYDTCIAHFVGPEDKEQPISECNRQKNMKFVEKKLNSPTVTSL